MGQVEVNRTTTDIGTAARMLGVPVETVRKRLQRGKLEGFKAENGTWRVVLDMAKDAVLPPPSVPDDVVQELHSVRQDIAELRGQIAEALAQLDRINRTLAVDGVPRTELMTNGPSAPDREVRDVLLAVLNFLQKHKGF